MLYILSGMSFAGKSVLAQAISKAKGIPVIDPDKVAHEMGLGLAGEFLSAEQWRQIHSKVEQRAKDLLSSGSSLVYDTTALNQEQRDHLKNLAEQSHVTPVVIAIRIPREEAYRRWEENNRTKERFLVHIDDFNMCADAFEFPDEDEPHLTYEAGQDINQWVVSHL